MWITNGGFADLFVVFAKVEREKFSAFIVERQFGGVVSGKEEHKLGLDGSSTTSVTFQETPVPVDNLLGDVGTGHKVAFNVLNFARLKLGATCAGSARIAVGEAARYAAARRQFGRPIASFGAIRHKLGEMIVRTYTADSINYRTAGLLDERLAAGWSPEALLSALEEFAVEASIAKVAGSETLDFVLDENVQIHGGNGFVRDYPAERYYRDARVNRIFEGTNEINRLLIPGLLAKRAAAASNDDERQSNPPIEPRSGPFAPQLGAIDRFKRVAMLTLGAAVQTFGKSISDEQEVLLHCADVLIDTYGTESAVLRAVAAADGPRADRHADVARIAVHDASLRMAASARHALSATLNGAALDGVLQTLAPLLTPAPVNTADLRRRLADDAVARGAYPF
jgi:alkylation response protein AidB-like acyl-CoA dehydrogenase